MQLRNKGFTLIEIIVVIVLLGIVATFAVPRYINLTTSARQTSTNSIAAALASASANNFAARTAGGSDIGSAITNCTNIGNLLSGGLPSGYSIASLAIPAGSAVSCTLTGTGGTSATFRGLGIN